jgi:hypothetical protein
LYWIGYILGTVMLITGVLVLSGVLFRFQTVPPEGGNMLRTVFGIVLVLYGLYRLVLTEMQRRERRRGGEE